MSPFKALVIREKGSPATLETLEPGDLPDGDVLVSVQYSSLNYKDGLAITQTSPVIRKFPMVPGVDLVGTVVESTSSTFQPGQTVIATGWEMGERYWGGYSQMAKVQADWLIPLPDRLTGVEAMAIGTAGLTAMLSIMALEAHGISSDRPILVTGAAGGVGSIAIALLSRLGYPVTASSGRHEIIGDYLHDLGATDVIGRLEPLQPALGSQQWSGAIDTVGGQTLATLLKTITYGGCVANCGLAGGSNLPTTVFPFILRNVSLLGIDSVLCPQEKRLQAWQRLTELLTDDLFELILNAIIPLDHVPTFSKQILAGQVQGRVVVDCNG
ncbi:MULTISPECIES: MDR family oxidoreductase [unclassified Leptolyngbya]|uniref:MDR family oxidoreductase n=1 Tax=unclassified Leptolyngbya TaxID=2650499 RepID=UPI001688FC60|nr:MULTISPECIES: MDR family oxidoreductase [unclassified Leptolyngbya]MBD1910265.1 oxidoreductase [Leptolyngbya sp. FACHB-8]MBD2156412.1 oxidoreductase [Leptolyngbya sp. FACHB-16]